MIIKIKVKDTATLAQIEEFDKGLQALKCVFSHVIESITSEKQ